MRRARWAALAAVTILSALSSACSPFSGPKNLIVGKWEPDDLSPGEKVTIEFTKDGKIHIRGNNERGKEIKVEGTYKFIDDNTIESTVDYGNGEQTEKGEILKITKEAMVTKGKNDTKEQKFKRVK